VLSLLFCVVLEWRQWLESDRGGRGVSTVAQSVCLHLQWNTLTTGWFPSSITSECGTNHLYMVHTLCIWYKCSVHGTNPQCVPLWYKVPINPITVTCCFYCVDGCTCTRVCISYVYLLHDLYFAKFSRITLCLFTGKYMHLFFQYICG